MSSILAVQCAVDRWRCWGAAQGLQVSGDDVEVLLRLPGLRILDLCKVSERLPCDAPGPPNEVCAALFCTLRLQRRLSCILLSLMSLGSGWPLVVVVPDALY